MSRLNSVTYLLHGYNIKDGGDATVEKLRPFLKNATEGIVISWRYGWFGLISVLLKNKKVAQKIRDNEINLRKDSKIFAVGHSNGCAILVEAARQGARFNHLLLINPALKVNTKFPDTINKITVVYTKHDIPTRAARFFDKIPLLQFIVPNAWGAMGARGYAGEDPRVSNLNLSACLSGHSDIFENENLMLFGDILANRLYENEVTV